MLVSRSCLAAILENLTVLNKEVEYLKKATYLENESKQIAGGAFNHLESHSKKGQSYYHNEDR